MSEEAEVQAQINQTPGLLLRQSREKLGLSQQDVADSLNLRLDIITHLEKDEYSAIGQPLFVRGYLKACARLFNVEEKIVMSLYDQMAEAPQIERQEMKSFSRRTKREANDSRLMLVTYILLALFAFFIVLWWWQRAQVPAEELRLAQVDTSVESTQEETTDPISSVDDDANDLVELQASLNPEPDSDELANVNVVDSSITNKVIDEQDGSANAQVVQVNHVIDMANAIVKDDFELDTKKTAKVDLITDNQDVAPNLAPEADIRPLLPETQVTISDIEKPANKVEKAEDSTADTTTVVMTFSDDCWLLIKDATDEVVASGVKKKDYVMTFSGVAPFNVQLGAPQNVTVEYDGEPVDISHLRSGRLARFSLPLED